MRVLWFAPWFRSEAHIYGRGLTREGHHVRVVTSERHPEPAPSLVPELVCPSKPYDPRWARVAAKLERSFREFRPDVVIADEITDPVLALLAQRVNPQWIVMHDALPHDHTHLQDWWRREVRAAGRRRAHHILTFSNHVEREVEAAKWKRHSTQVHRVKLITNLLDEDVPYIREAPERRDFVLMGRIAPYKNIDHALRAWAEHVNGAHYRGDRLIIWGTGAWREGTNGRREVNEDTAVEWRSDVYRYSEIREGLFSGFKGSLCVYSESSQSQVQVLNGQLGVAPIVSNVGGLPEYQDPALPILDPHDLWGLVEVLNRLADSEYATKCGKIARRHYESSSAQAVASRELAVLLEQSIATS